MKRIKDKKQGWMIGSLYREGCIFDRDYISHMHWNMGSQPLCHLFDRIELPTSAIIRWSINIMYEYIGPGPYSLPG